MDDSDLDFTDLCSRLLKRKVRKKAGEQHEQGRDGDSQSKASVAGPSCPKQTKKTTSQPKKRTKKDGSSERVVVGKTSTEPRTAVQVLANIVLPAENGTEVQPQTSTQTSEPGSVKETVLRRMQKFRRVDPQKIQHADSNSITTTSTEPECPPPPPPPPAQNNKGMTNFAVVCPIVSIV